MTLLSHTDGVALRLLKTLGDFATGYVCPLCSARVATVEVLCCACDLRVRSFFQPLQVSLFSQRTSVALSGMNGRACAAAVYTDDLRRAVMLWKEKHARQLGDRLCARAARSVSGVLPAYDVLVPIPSSPWRALVRGLDPPRQFAEHLAAARAPRSGQRDGEQPMVEALKRRRFSPLSRRLSRRQRAKRSRGLFACTSEAHRVKGLRVLLVDDVVTTGSTLRAAARLLRASGAAEVHAVALAYSEANL